MLLKKHVPQPKKNMVHYIFCLLFIEHFTKQTKKETKYFKYLFYSVVFQK